jgi:hypothetical protein
VGTAVNRDGVAGVVESEGGTAVTARVGLAGVESAAVAEESGLQAAAKIRITARKINPMTRYGRTFPITFNLWIEETGKLFIPLILA